MRSRRTPVWRPSADQMKRWPAASGNAINGVGEETRRRPSPVYWHAPETIPHGPLQRWFYERTGDVDGTAEPVAIGNERSTSRLSLSRKTPAKWRPTNGPRTRRRRRSMAAPTMSASRRCEPNMFSKASRSQNISE